MPAIYGEPLWYTALGASALIAFALSWIAARTWYGLIHSHQVRSNRLGCSAAGIFTLLAAGEIFILVLMVLMSVPSAFSPDLQTWRSLAWGATLIEVAVAIVALYYIRLRFVTPHLDRKSPRFLYDITAARAQAVEMNDNVLQGIVLAQMYLELGDREQCHRVLGITLENSRDIMTTVLGEQRVRPGDLVREHATTSAAAMCP